MAKDMMRTDRNGFSVIDGYSDKKTLVGVMHDIARSGMIDDFPECKDFRKVSKKAEAEEWLIPSNKVETGEYYFEVDFEFGYFCLCLVADTTKAEPTEEATTETVEAPVKMTAEQIEKYGENYSNGRMTNTEACATCCEHCTKKFECPHAEAYRRLPRTAGGLGLCPNLADAKNAVEVVETYKESVIRKAEPTPAGEETSEETSEALTSYEPADLESIASSLIDGGWTVEDVDMIQSEYSLTDDDLGKVIETMEDMAAGV